MSRHTAIYVRVSSRTQDTRSQELELKRWAGGSDGEVRWYRETASGASMDRPVWQRLEAEIATGRVARVVVWRLDRLGRTAVGLVRLFDDLKARGVGLVSLQDNLDITTPMGMMVAQILASVAQFEREIRGERQRAGIEAAKAEGRRWGGRKPGQRYKVDAEKERAIRRMLEAGATKAEIARQLGIARCTVYDVLRAG